VRAYLRVAYCVAAIVVAESFDEMWQRRVDGVVERQVEKKEVRAEKRVEKVMEKNVCERYHGYKVVTDGGRRWHCVFK
jgi:hypothetical protein